MRIPHAELTSLEEKPYDMVTNTDGDFDSNFVIYTY